MNHQQQLQDEISRRQHALTRPGNTPALNQALQTDIEHLKRQLATLTTPNPDLEDEAEDENTEQDPHP